MKERLCFLVWAGIVFALFLTGCERGRPMVWTPTQDGFEQSYFREPNGPAYVRRKIASTGCVFSDFPDNQAPTETHVACGMMWTGTYGHQLTCLCADGGS